MLMVMVNIRDSKMCKDAFIVHKIMGMTTGARKKEIDKMGCFPPSTVLIDIMSYLFLFAMFGFILLCPPSSNKNPVGAHG